MGVLRKGTNGKIRKTGSAPLRGASVHASQNQFSKWLGFHGDEDNGLEHPDLVTEIFNRCHVSPANANGAMCLWRHVAQLGVFPESVFEDFIPQRAAAAALGYEDPTMIMVPFTDDNPGTGTEGEALAVLAALEDAIDLYGLNGENPIFGFGNLTSGNFMPADPDDAAAKLARRTAWFALEARVFELIEDMGFRWCSTDDSGISFLCLYMADRRAAWNARVDPDACEFACTHSYTDSGFVPAHYRLALASFARAGVTTPIRITEGAYGFLGAGNTDEDKPWLFEDWAIDYVDPTHGSHPQALTWTRLKCEWFRTNGFHYLLFDDTMKVRIVEGTPQLSPWGIIWTQDQDEQPVFAEPLLGSLWFKEPDAMNLAYSLRLSNTDGGAAAIAAALAAYTRIEDGLLFTIAA